MDVPDEDAGALFAWDVIKLCQQLLLSVEQGMLQDGLQAEHRVFSNNYFLYKTHGQGEQSCPHHLSPFCPRVTKNKIKNQLPRAPSDESSSSATGRKDTILLVERHQRDDDFLSVYTFQVGLGKEPHAESPSVLGEHNGILPQPHGARLEAVAIRSTGWEVSLLSLLCETEAESIGRSGLLLCGSATSQPRPLHVCPKAVFKALLPPRLLTITSFLLSYHRRKILQGASICYCCISFRFPEAFCHPPPLRFTGKYKKNYQAQGISFLLPTQYRAGRGHGLIFLFVFIS